MGIDHQEYPGKDMNPADYCRTNYQRYYETQYADAPDEETIFNALGMAYVKPEQRM